MYFAGFLIIIVAFDMLSTFMYCHVISYKRYCLLPNGIGAVVLIGCSWTINYKLLTSGVRFCTNKHANHDVILTSISFVLEHLHMDMILTPCLVHGMQLTTNRLVVLVKCNRNLYFSFSG